jgi:hypothetical protein
LAIGRGASEEGRAKGPIDSRRPCARVACEGELSLVRALAYINIYIKSLYQVQKNRMFSQLSPVVEFRAVLIAFSEALDKNFVPGRPHHPMLRTYVIFFVNLAFFYCTCDFYLQVMYLWPSFYLQVLYLWITSWMYILIHLTVTFHNAKILLSPYLTIFEAYWGFVTHLEDHQDTCQKYCSFTTLELVHLLIYCNNRPDTSTKF